MYSTTDKENPTTGHLGGFNFKFAMGNGLGQIKSCFTMK